MRIELLDSGATKYTFRQSWINDHLLCAERSRVPVKDATPTDAMILGTALHSVIEADLLDGLDSLKDAVRYGDHQLDALIEEGVTWVKDDARQIRQMLGHMVQSWWVSPNRAFFMEMRAKNTVLTEHSFELLFDTDEQGNELWLTGQMDALVVSSTHARVYDWKTAGQAYKKWEKQRWAVQPTVYTWAASQLFELPTDFEYVVFLKRLTGATIESMPITRDEGHWDFLRRQLWSITNLNPEVTWPLNDQHALCSSKYCPKFMSCKGMFVDV